MTFKQFKLAKIIAAIIVAAVVGQSVVRNNFFIPIITVVVAALILLYLKSRVREVVVDERDLKIAGRTAIITIQAYGWLAMVVMFVLYSQRQSNPVFEPIAATLAYATCVLLVVYTVVFALLGRIFKHKT